MGVNNKKEGNVLIKNFSRKYKKKIPISNYKYKDAADMEESVFDFTLKIQGQKNWMTSIQVNDLWEILLQSYVVWRPRTIFILKSTSEWQQEQFWRKIERYELQENSQEVAWC